MIPRMLSKKALFVLGLVCPMLAVAQTDTAPRVRLSINDGWRFRQGDPAGNKTPLLYDVRPEVTDARDDKAADSTPEEAARIAAAKQGVLKPWILPTANTFIKDPAKRHARPAAPDPARPAADAAIGRGQAGGDRAAHDGLGAGRRDHVHRRA